MKQSVRAIVIKGNTLLVMKRNKFGSEYYTLVGGGVDVGETADQAVRRELSEETGLQVGRIGLVYTEDGGKLYGEQLVYWCEYLEGEPVLQSTSEEAKISALGKNTYEPMWLPIARLSDIPFRSGSLQRALCDALVHGFPEQPQRLEWQPENMTH